MNDRFGESRPSLAGRHQPHEWSATAQWVTCLTIGVKLFCRKTLELYSGLILLNPPLQGWFHNPTVVGQFYV